MSADEKAKVSIQAMQRFERQCEAVVSCYAVLIEIVEMAMCVPETQKQQKEQGLLQAAPGSHSRSRSTEAAAASKNAIDRIKPRPIDPALYTSRLAVEDETRAEGDDILSACEDEEMRVHPSHPARGKKIPPSQFSSNTDATATPPPPPPATDTHTDTTSTSTSIAAAGGGGGEGPVVSAIAPVSLSQLSRGLAPVHTPHSSTDKAEKSSVEAVNEEEEERQGL